jgi:methyltransferase
VTDGLRPMATVDAVTLAVIVGLMLAETYRSRVNERALAARGAVRPEGDVWIWMAALYPLSFVLMGAEGIWRAEQASDLTALPWYFAGLGLFVAAKVLKYWAIRTLAERWSFRVMIVPGVPLVRGGPYRYLTHPNYVGVVGELVGTAMMMKAALVGPVMCLAFGIVLWGRVRFENRMLTALAPSAE